MLLEDFAVVLTCYEPICRTRMPNTAPKQVPGFLHPKFIYREILDPPLYFKWSFISFLHSESIPMHSFHPGQYTWCWWKNNGSATCLCLEGAHRWVETKDGNEKIQDSEFDVRSRDCVWGTVSANGKMWPSLARGLRLFTEVATFELSCEREETWAAARAWRPGDKAASCTLRAPWGVADGWSSLVSWVSTRWRW